jgi:hypothetical protein
MLATVFAHYETNVILPKRRDPDRMTNVERGFLLTRDRLMDFLSEKLPDGSMRSVHGKATRVSALDLPTQRAFWRVLHKLGCSARSIAIYMSYIAAAVNDAAKPRVVERDGREESSFSGARSSFSSTSLSRLSSRGLGLGLSAHASDSVSGTRYE